jgi:hypothetical protein
MKNQSEKKWEKKTGKLTHYCSLSAEIAAHVLGLTLAGHPATLLREDSV